MTAGKPVKGWAEVQGRMGMAERKVQLLADLPATEERALELHMFVSLQQEV